jgi:16S rRNA (cytosine1402-N4)-methyltransferase
MSKAHPPHVELHKPVLLDAVLELMDPHEGESYLDLTAGYGGHAKAFIERTHNETSATLVDRDDYAISKLEDFERRGARLIHADFVSAARQLINEGMQFNIVFIDLGVSSPQLDQGERGFSFKNSGPLDMRMDRRQQYSAEVLVNNAPYDDLVRIIHEYGEEPLAKAKHIAYSIVKHRPLQTTGELAELIKKTIRGQRSKIHPATRTFQSFRIAVNQEIQLINEILPLIPKLLKKGGRVGIISFHSLEDRLVKHYFAEQQKAGFESELRILNKKPVDGTVSDANNPRARSAKLRVAVKI